MHDEAITYEVALEPDPEILGEFEAWLEGHADEMLELPGFVGASIHKAEDPATGRPLRVVRYQLESRAALDRYLAEFAPRMRADGLARFGDRFMATRRIVEEGRDAALTDARPCPNCSELLWGQYCANCGQRAQVRMITFWELVKDAADVLASLDSRLWRTLGLLLFRPGRLTLDYLQGKRARYAPPARLFIASSLVFFFIATLNTRFEFGPDGSMVIGHSGDPVESAEGLPTARERTEEALQRAREGAAQRAEQAEADPGAQGSREGTKAGIKIDDDCTVDYAGTPEWLPRILPPERAEQVCRQIKADHGRSFVRAIISNIPAMMFLFLPLMAAVMKLAYPLSGRYYAEHLLFLVHFHSFFFLLNIGLILLHWGADLVVPGSIPLGVLTAIAFIYIPVYLFRAMRLVYGQGVLATTFKYGLLGLAYLIALVFTFLGLVVYTAVTL
jgi:hypothetical protein